MLGMFNMLLDYFASESSKLFNQLLLSFTSSSLMILKLPLVKLIQQYTQYFLISLLGIKVSYEIIMIYLLRAQGDKNFNVSDWVFRMVYAVFLIMFLPDIVPYIWNVGTEFANNINQMGTSTSQAIDLSNTVNSLGMGPLYLALLIVACAILMLIVMFQSYVRSIELVIYLFVGMFTALGISSNADAMKPFYKKIIALSMSQAVVVFLIKILFLLLTGASSIGGFDRLMLGIASLWVAVFVPSTIETYMGSTGIGKTLDSATKLKDNIMKWKKW